MSAQPIEEFYFYIDVVGTCNLECPSCPVGNSKEITLPKGLMDPELLDRIMQKATNECDVTGVGLFNWTEPLLHPKLPELIRIVQSYGIPCSISTNLNILSKPDDLMAANPNSLYISLSGFTQETYGITHRKGDIEQVKANIRILADSKSQLNGATNLTIIFHRYRHNRQEELLMQKFSAEVGINFKPVWAFMMPLEKVLSAANVDIDAKLNTKDIEVIRRLALPMDRALAVARKHRNKPCKLRSNQITLNLLGDVTLCCAVFDSEKYKIANFITTPLKEIQNRRFSNSLCSQCINVGAHVYFSYEAPEFESIAMKRYS